ncbi:hypothetical protein VdG2_03129 [Verticillium dahliae VDG2]|nr:hypothetical protein VdG2_03129 [Verticillium dahliae VDG2]
MATLPPLSAAYQKGLDLIDEAHAGDPKASETTPPIPYELHYARKMTRKENLAADEETQVLEDVACLVFLDDQFDGFESKEEIDEPKIIGILQKTWAKMSEPGRALALKMDLSERATALITKALAG